VLRSRLPLALAVAAVVAAGCGPAAGTEAAPSNEPGIAAPASEDVAAGEPSGVAAEADGRVWIDVRTPAEIAEGALDGALHIDLQGPDFAAAIGELPRDGAYFVYCRSGNRSGQAIEIMRELGFTDLVNGGGFEDLAEAGLPTT
jgi:phage shock protein E